MGGTPVDRISIRLSPDPRLARAVRAAVLWEGREWGMPISRAAPFASAVAGRFREISRQPAGSRAALVHLTLEPGKAEFLVRLAPGGGGRTWLFKGQNRRLRRKARTV